MVQIDPHSVVLSLVLRVLLLRIHVCRDDVLVVQHHVDICVIENISRIHLITASLPGRMLLMFSLSELSSEGDG